MSDEMEESQETSEMQEESDEDDVTTPEEVLKKMTWSWQNELSAPCLLPTQMELVEILLDQIQGMEDNINKQKNKSSLRISVHRVELQRISYITSDYLRCRLRKIEANPFDAIDQHKKRADEGMADLLSEQELKFAKEYAKTEVNLYERTALESVPPGLKKIQVPTSDYSEEFVYAKVVADDVENVTIPDWTDLNTEVVLEMEKDSVHLIPFTSVKHLVENGTIKLM